MQGNILQSDVEKRGVVFDPRTKMLILITLAIFVLGGSGGEKVDRIGPFLCMIPFVLMILARKWKKAFTYLVLYLASYISFMYLGVKTTGIVNFILLAVCGIFSRFLPGIMMGTYLIETTTVSEFIAAMSKLHTSEKITIPLSVMFRFFPTVADEFSSINSAMKMRGITLGEKNVGKMVEYRMVPLMVCLAKIGEELNAAALTRGLGGDVRRTNICKIGFHLQDFIFLGICLVPYILWFIDLICKI